MTKPKHKAHLQIVIFEAEHSKLKGPFIKKITIISLNL